jgi:hypothetical protein
MNYKSSSTEKPQLKWTKLKLLVEQRLLQDVARPEDDDDDEATPPKPIVSLD